MLKLAWRNLWRNRTRTIIVTTVISLTYAMALVSLGIGESSHKKMEESAVRAAGGNILVNGEGYWELQTNEYLISNAAAVTSALEDLPSVDSVVPRVIVTGMMQSPRGVAPIRLMGIDPEAEVPIRDWSEKLVAGTFLEDDGSGTRRIPVVLGQGIVEDLESELGARNLVLHLVDHNGEDVARPFYLAGILDTGFAALDDFAAFATIPDARRTLGLADDELTQLAIVLADDEQRYAVQSQIKAVIADIENPGGKNASFEVLTWDDAIPEMLAFIEIDDAFSAVYGIIILIVVGFGIANTFLMSVMERVRELGLLGALGLTPRKIGRLVLSEALLLALLSVTIGFAIGFGLHMYIQAEGINLAEVYNMDMDMAGVTLDDVIVRSVINPTRWIVTTITVFGLVLFSCLYPAFKATRLDPAQAMRTYE